MSLPRTVRPEILDALAPEDPRAQRSRRDLRRLNRIIASAQHLEHALGMLGDHATPMRLLEIGAGDGRLMLRVAKRLCHRWPRAELTLLDQQNLIERSTLDALQKTGWRIEVVVDDVLHWFARQSDAHWDIVIANLFLHHFNACRLRWLLQALARRSDGLVACEPRRARLPLFASHLVGAVGANEITRSDAVASVHAGFRARELSELWPRDCGSWQLREYAAGAFSHCFVAERARS